MNNANSLSSDAIASSSFSLIVNQPVLKRSHIGHLFQRFFRSGLKTVAGPEGDCPGPEPDQAVVCGQGLNQSTTPGARIRPAEILKGFAMNASLPRGHLHGHAADHVARFIHHHLKVRELAFEIAVGNPSSPKAPWGRSSTVARRAWNLNELITRMVETVWGISSVILPVSSEFRLQAVRIEHHWNRGSAELQANQVRKRRTR